MYPMSNRRGLGSLFGGNFGPHRWTKMVSTNEDVGSARPAGEGFRALKFLSCNGYVSHHDPNNKLQSLHVDAIALPSKKHTS